MSHPAPVPGGWLWGFRYCANRDPRGAQAAPVKDRRR
jgi:hypothetical protein